MKDKKFYLAWFSCGVTSAVACKLAIEKYGIDNVKVAYIHIDTHNNDNIRFIRAFEKSMNCNISVLQSDKYSDQFEVIEHKRFVNSPYGAACTKALKKDVRRKWELLWGESIISQIWGFEFEKSQVNRAIRFSEQYPYTKPSFPLIEAKLNKSDCAAILVKMGIKLPEMYRLGYSNNNCWGCVKGGKGYWNKIRIDKPRIFNKMALLEREVGRSCIRGVFLDELKPEDGYTPKPILPNCGTICEVDFSDIPAKNLVEVLETGQIPLSF